MAAATHAVIINDSTTELPASRGIRRKRKQQRHDGKVGAARVVIAATQLSGFDPEAAYPAFGSGMRCTFAVVVVGRPAFVQNAAKRGSSL